MFKCPYCQQVFTTKQRLISHLTRINKCYDVKKVGVPPILAELMGCGQEPEQATEQVPEHVPEQKVQKKSASSATGNSSASSHRNMTIDEKLPIMFKSKKTDPDANVVVRKR